ncbi:hypothetical protein [Labrenzia sp. OB1]|uniref:hypothetical protein n=1 Tax=Labrenzia sp. OB1 TaxID=1561204 RepID=UPI0007B2301E|nr:hypothetical protein [Labrenzia sp. OB1]KZM48264.1 hypothetical protein OA90_21130 [Labrenzia sp. OB1]
MGKNVRLDMLIASRAVNALEEKIRGLGLVDIRTHDDPSSFFRVVSDSNKATVGEHFRETLNVLPPSRFYAISIHDQDGRAVATTANRYDDVSGWSLQEYVRRFWSVLFKSADGSPAVLLSDSASFAADLHGPFVYIGDTFVDKDYNGNDLAALLCRMCIILCAMNWKPAYIYAWMRPKHALKGLPLRWGFPITYLHALDWEKPPEISEYADLCFLGCDHHGVWQLLRDILGTGPETIDASSIGGTQLLPQKMVV